MKTVQNEYGISIKVCCASCVFKALDSGGLRICTNGRGHVKRTDSCDGWMMKKALRMQAKAAAKSRKATISGSTMNKDSVKCSSSLTGN